MYTLPDLQYDYSALEPYYSAELLDLHHNHHHASYVSGANAAVAELEDARERNDFTTLNALEKKLAFNLSGHVLHSLLWKNLSPTGGNKPEGELAAAIDENFGSFELFRRQLSQAVMTVHGSGWGVLLWEPIGEALYIGQIHDHQDNLCQAARPLLVMDGWEHAYYLQYRTARVDYVDAMWSIVNWDDVAARFARALHITTL
jgi:Fe-Mn family superoxide dismutase